MEKQAVITATALCIGYRTHKGEKKVHEHLSFGLYPGELTSLLGANGAGKSTLLRTLSASQPSLAGELQLLGKPLQQYSEKERSRTIGVVLTDKTQAGGLTVYELVALGRQPHTGFFGRLHPKDHLIIKEALDAVGIAHKAESYTEPTAFLDVVSRIEIMTLLHQLAVEQNKAILLSTHDIEQALVLSDKLWLLSKETGLQCGVTEDMILNHRMDTLFSHSNIRFDYDHGIYYPTVNGKQEITVEATDETLLHWTINALNRHGYTCLQTQNAPAGLPHLQVIAPDALYLTRGGKQRTFTSFGKLLEEIK